MDKLSNYTEETFVKKVHDMYTLILKLGDEFEEHDLIDSKKHLEASYKAFERDVMNSILKNINNH